MQRLLTVLVVAAMATLFSTPALADNQEVANQIAAALRDSGKLSNYRIEVRYQQGTASPAAGGTASPAAGGGTARLKGHVRDQTQMNTALKLAFQIEGVSRVVNELTIGTARPAASQFSRPAPVNSKRPVATGRAVPEKLRPQPTSAIALLRKVVAGIDPRHSPQGRVQPSNTGTAGRVQRVPTSFKQAPARPVAAVQTQPATQTQTQPATQIQAAMPPQAAVQGMPRAMVMRPAGRPIPIAYTQAAGGMPGPQMQGGPVPAYVAGRGGGVAPARYDQPRLPNHSWPSYASYPNYAGLTYPRQYSPTAWPYIGPFYPYPQVPLGWRKVTLEWDDGWWMLDFRDSPSGCR